MPAAEKLTLSKKERICSKKLINELFTGNGRSMTAFPLRVVYMKRTIDSGQPQAEMLVSVPKRYFKHAVDRNRIKRQVREAFRRNKHTVTAPLNTPTEAVAMAFVWLSNEHMATTEVENRMVSLLTRISERL